MARHRDQGSEVTQARLRRRAMTSAERMLWQALRAHRFHGLGFRRQHPVGSLHVAFARPALRLAVEIDEAGNMADGPARDALLRALGWRVARVAGREVTENPARVLARLEGLAR